MTDAGPRIFRTLEKDAGRGGFDTIVNAAVAAYGSLRAPTATQARDFGKLIAPVWERVSEETQRTLAAALSRSPRVPRELVDLLIAAPIEVSAPFLMRSPALSAADVEALTRSGDPRVVKLIEQREPPRISAASSRKTAEKPKDADPATDEVAAILPASPAVSATPSQPKQAPARVRLDSPPLAFDAAEEATSPAAPVTAAGVRETLRRLVRAGRANAPRDALPSAAELTTRALRRDEEGFYTGLAQALSLSPARLAEIRAEATGELLAIALKALQLTPPDALSVLMLLKPRLGLDINAFDGLNRYYRQLKAEDCRRLVGGAPSRPILKAPKLQPQTADLQAPARGPQRAHFGRRKQAPASRSSQRS